MNLTTFADASFGQLFNIIETADNNNSQHYLFNNDIERNIYLDRRNSTYEYLDGRYNVLYEISEACEEIQYYLDYMVASGYEKLIVDSNEVKYFEDEDEEFTYRGNVDRNKTNVYFEFNKIEDSIKIYYKLGNVIVIDLFIY